MQEVVITKSEIIFWNSEINRFVKRTTERYYYLNDITKDLTYFSKYVWDQLIL